MYATLLFKFNYLFKLRGDGWVFVHQIVVDLNSSRSRQRQTNFLKNSAIARGGQWVVELRIRLLLFIFIIFFFDIKIANI